jgi:hypothetical protein
MNPIVKWVLQTMMKGQTGVVRTLPNKKLLDINVNMTVERLIKNGIDPSAIKTPGQVDNIIKQIEQPKVIPADSPRGRGITEALFGKKGEVFDMEGKKIKPGSKIMGGKEVKDSNVDAIIQDIKSLEPITAMKEANNIIARKGKYKNLTKAESKKILQETEDHIFERDVPFDPQEDFAIGGRVGLKAGMNRRAFLKLMGGVGAGIGALKTGLLKLAGKGAASQAAKEIIKTPSAAGKPEWFDALVTKVINQGEDVTKRFATKDREVVHLAKIDDDATVTVYRDLDTGTVRVDVSDATKNVADDQGEAIVSMEVRGGQLEEGVKGKTPAEFEAVEADYRNYTTSPDGDYDTEVVENVVNNTKDLTADLTKLKIYARGDNKPTMKEFVESKKRQTKLEQAAKDPADYASDRGPQYDPPDPEPDDFASGGLAGMLGE